MRYGGHACRDTPVLHCAVPRKCNINALLLQRGVILCRQVQNRLAVSARCPCQNISFRIQFSPSFNKCTLTKPSALMSSISGGSLGFSPLRASLRERYGLSPASPEAPSVTTKHYGLSHDSDTLTPCSETIMLDLRARQVSRSELLAVATKLPQCKKLERFVSCHAAGRVRPQNPHVQCKP